MSNISLKTYLLFSITIVLATAITYYSVKYNPIALVPWSISGLFFLLWRIEAERPRVRKSKPKKVKKLL
jgi:hypothetical protein